MKDIKITNTFIIYIMSFIIKIKNNNIYNKKEKGVLMRKLKIILLSLIMLMIGIASYAAIDTTIHFDISYEGEVKVNEEKKAIIILAGDNTPLHTNVRVKVDIEGPAKPKLLATDSLGTEIDIANWGYWGPETGFTIAGTFTNETPVRATFTEEGAYTITLTLLDVQNNNDILAQKAVTIQVEGDEPIVNDTVNEVTNQQVEELPKTGTSLIEYTIYAIVLFVIVYLGYQIKERRK